MNDGTVVRISNGDDDDYGNGKNNSNNNDAIALSRAFISVHAAEAD
jgi:hypothetical protein